MPQTETPPQPVTPPAAIAASIADQYELGEETPPTPAVPEPGASVVAPAPVDTPTLPRGPDGRFLPADAPTTHKHSPRLVRMATDLGLSEAEIAAASPEILDETVYHLNRQAFALARENSRDPELRRQTAPPADPAKTLEADPLAALKEEDYDPGIAELIRTVRSQAKEIKELKEGLGGVRNFQQARVQESLATQCDRAFEKHEGVLGKGKGTDLQPTDPHYIRRKAVLALVDQMPKKGNLADRIDKAVETLFGAPPAPAPTPATETRLSPEQQAWNDGTVARPTQRKPSDEPPGRKRAEAAVASFLHEQAQLSPESAEEFLP